MLSNIRYFMALLALTQKIIAMEVEVAESSKITMTPTENENAYKMWLIHQHLEVVGNEDVWKVIFDIFYELTKNPVLDSNLIYTRPSDKKKFIFMIRNHINKNGTFDLSNVEIFGKIAKYLIITTSIDDFIHTDKNSEKLIILLAPLYLIEKNLESFKPIWDKWKITKTPVGFFWRMHSCGDLSRYHYLTHWSISMISGNNFHTLGEMSYCSPCFEETSFDRSVNDLWLHSSYASCFALEPKLELKDNHSCVFEDPGSDWEESSEEDSQCRCLLM